MAKKAKTKEEKDYMGLVAQLGCSVCSLMPVELHHPRRGTGMALKASHFDVIPLCPDHHRTGGYGVAIHAGQKKWEGRYGSEQDHVEKTKKLINETKACSMSSMLKSFIHQDLCLVGKCI